jgi:hypothetical protein
MRHRSTLTTTILTCGLLLAVPAEAGTDKSTGLVIDKVALEGGDLVVAGKASRVGQVVSLVSPKASARANKSRKFSIRKKLNALPTDCKVVLSSRGKVSAKLLVTGCAVRGATGAKGPQGVAGTIGATGPAGVAGPVGSAGPEGPVGATGPAGPTGLQGPAGSQGPTGSQGIQGIQGPAGQNSVLSVTPVAFGTGAESVTYGNAPAALRWIGAKNAQQPPSISVEAGDTVTVSLGVGPVTDAATDRYNYVYVCFRPTAEALSTSHRIQPYQYVQFPPSTRVPLHMSRSFTVETTGTYQVGLCMSDTLASSLTTDFVSGFVMVSH